MYESFSLICANTEQKCVTVSILSKLKSLELNNFVFQPTYIFCALVFNHNMNFSKCKNGKAFQVGITNHYSKVRAVSKFCGNF